MAGAAEEYTPATAGDGALSLGDQFRKVTATSINDQSTFFLRSFVGEFGGKFEEVLDLAEEFKKYAPKEGVVRELEEDQAHLFLERRGETLTVRALRDHLREIDLDKNHKVSFIEYALWKFKKTITELFAEKPGNMQALLDQLEAAIKAYQEQLARKQAREDKIAGLKEIITTGSGVKKSRASVELDAMMAEDELERNRSEITAGAKKRSAQKAVDKGDPYQMEQDKLAKEKKAKDEAEKAERKAKRDAFAAKIAKQGLA